MAEETVPFVLIFVPLALALGYDSITGAAIPFVGSGVGFSAAFFNPFTVGVAQGIAGRAAVLWRGLPLRPVVGVHGIDHRVRELARASCADGSDEKPNLHK